MATLLYIIYKLRTLIIFFILFDLLKKILIDYETIAYKIILINKVDIML